LRTEYRGAEDDHSSRRDTGQAGKQHAHTTDRRFQETTGNLRGHAAGDLTGDFLQGKGAGILTNRLKSEYSQVAPAQCLQGSRRGKVQMQEGDESRAFGAQVPLFITGPFYSYNDI